MSRYNFIFVARTSTLQHCGALHCGNVLFFYVIGECCVSVAPRTSCRALLYSSGVDTKPHLTTRRPSGLFSLLYRSPRRSRDQPPACTAAAHLLISSPVYIKDSFHTHTCQVVLLLGCCSVWVIHVCLILVADFLPADSAVFACLIPPVCLHVKPLMLRESESFTITCPAWCVCWGSTCWACIRKSSVLSGCPWVTWFY